MKLIGLLVITQCYELKLTSSGICGTYVIILSNSSSYGLFFLEVSFRGCSLASANILCDSTMCPKLLLLLPLSGKYVGRVLKSVSLGCRGMLLDSEFAVYCKGYNIIVRREHESLVSYRPTVYTYLWWGHDSWWQ